MGPHTILFPAAWMFKALHFDVPPGAPMVAEFTVPMPLSWDDGAVTFWPDWSFPQGDA